MRAQLLGPVCEAPVRELGVEDTAPLADAVNALLFALTLNVPAGRVPTPTPASSERAGAETTDLGGSLDAAPHTHVSARGHEGIVRSDGPARRRALGSDESLDVDIEALVRLAAARSAAPTMRAATPAAPSAPQVLAPTVAPEPVFAPSAIAVPSLASTPSAQVEFGEGGADATIEVAHPELGPIRLEITLSAGGIALRALTPSTATAAALRALEATFAKAFTSRGLAFRSLRVDVGSDSRATLSRTQRRRRDFEEEA